MKRILLCGMKYENNFGDTIINECTKNLLEKVLKEENIEYELKEIDLCGRVDFNKKYFLKRNINYFIRHIIGKTCRLFRKVSKKLRTKKLYNFLDDLQWYFSDEYSIFLKYFKNEVRNNDFIIFVGGGMIKYKYQNCYHYIDCISKYADKYEKNIYLNSVGVEGFDEKNYKCRKLKRALNRKSIKMITTRDDIVKLKKYITKNDIKLDKVCDPAVYSNMVYKVEAKNNSKYIGLCVCRDNLFIDNGIKFSPKEMLEMWENIIKFLEKRGYKWKIYTNGLEGDNEFAYKLLKYIGKEDTEETIVIPNNDCELVKIISEFKGVIATRLHSCIISYSLNIPVIGLVWNNKLKLFGESINYPNRFIERNDFEANIIVKELEKSFLEQYSKTDIRFKESVLKSIKEVVDKYIK